MDEVSEREAAQARIEDIKQRDREAMLKRAESARAAAELEFKKALPTFTICADDPGAIAMLDAYADWLVTRGNHADPATKSKIRSIHNVKKTMQDWLLATGEKLIPVCASCSRACCLDYVQQCVEKKGRAERTLSYLRFKQLEHPSWWR